MSFISYIREIGRGKSINRILSNMALSEVRCHGKILDIGGGNKASYRRFIQFATDTMITRVDIDAHAKPDVILNVEKEKLPFAAESFDGAIACNIFEHINDRSFVVREISRVLVKGGRLIGTIPFLVRVHPDPHDFARLTNEGLESLFIEAGFRSCTIKPIGRGPMTAAYLQIEVLLPRFMRVILIGIVFMVDAIVLRLKPLSMGADHYPLSYLFIAEKATS